MDLKSFFHGKKNSRNISLSNYSNSETLHFIKIYLNDEINSVDVANKYIDEVEKSSIDKLDKAFLIQEILLIIKSSPTIDAFSTTNSIRVVGLRSNDFKPSSISIPQRFAQHVHTISLLACSAFSCYITYYGIIKDINKAWGGIGLSLLFIGCFFSQLRSKPYVYKNKFINAFDKYWSIVFVFGLLAIYEYMSTINFVKQSAIQEAYLYKGDPSVRNLLYDRYEEFELFHIDQTLVVMLAIVITASLPLLHFIFQSFAVKSETKVTKLTQK